MSVVWQELCCERNGVTLTACGPSRLMRRVSAQEMLRPTAIIAAIFCIVCCSSTNANERVPLNVAEYALQETRDILSRELFGHYDITELEVLKLNDRVVLDVRDYGLAKVTLRFSAKRNAKSTLNPSLLEPGGCLASLYLHCGVAAGHVFAGKLEVLLAIDREGVWRAVDPNWRSRRQYPLSGYLLLEGRKKEGYVVPPK